MIQLQNINKQFGRKQVLDEVSFQVPEGKITGLLGPNGAGKSTIMRIINRIHQPDSGMVKFGNHLMTEQDLQSMGYLPEERGLYKTMTVEEHAFLFGQLRGLSKKDVQTKLDFWLEHFEITDWRKKRVEELSKGMAQKVQFICCVLHEPEFLVLDEPFSGFDPINIDLIQRELKRMRSEGKTILLSTHDMRNVEDLCDFTVLVNKGQVIAQGTVQELQQQLDTARYAVKFRGNMIAFVNALWAGYDLVEKQVLADDLFLVHLTMRGENTFDSLLQTLSGQVSIEGAWKEDPGMQEVFLHLVTKNNQEV